MCGMLSVRFGIRAMAYKVGDDKIPSIAINLSDNNVILFATYGIE